MYSYFLKESTKLILILSLVSIISGCGFATSTDDVNSTDQSSLMVLIPSGYFSMGYQIPALGESSQTYSVWLDDYYIDTYEVTNASYQRCVDEGRCNPPPNGKGLEEYSREEYYDNPAFKFYPVVNITWMDASAYCEWRGARLPTEAEWQKAARGTDMRVYPWGNAEPTCNLANFGFANQTCSPPPHLAQVGSQPDGVSPYGVYDLAGNVEEMVADCYVEDPSNYLSKNVRNPIAPETQGCRRVFHGGSFFLDGIKFLKIDTRNGAKPEFGSFTLGFRCVISP